MVGYRVGYQGTDSGSGRILCGCVGGCNFVMVVVVAVDLVEVQRSYSQ